MKYCSCDIPQFLYGQNAVFCQSCGLPPDRKTGYDNPEPNESPADFYCQMVAEWHRAFGQPVRDFPTLPDLETTKRRLNLMDEELREVEQAMIDGKVEEIAKELMDLIYVTAGTLVELGLRHKALALFSEVHRSNMSKTASLSQALRDAAIYEEERGVPCDVVKSQADEKYLIIRKRDGKVMKPSTYSEADIGKVLYGRKKSPGV